MQSTVTLELYEYNDLYLKAIQHDDLKEENEKLKEELTNTLKQLEVVKQPKDDTPTYTVKLDGSKVYEAVKKAADEFKREQKVCCNKQNYMICNYLKDDVVFVAKHIIIANEKDMKRIKERFNEINWIEL
ncbi:hypothetical protein [Macrococcoides caseolyticum]|uniref:Uncharacterized protein n=1 Tax=Macrococcoides caseolyticum TaxID=69966 RepID=A0ACC9MUC7_9STAP|nr:hypothetical protein [Macrococcus caseolyticus]PKE47242.1 hypothetical protein CW677_08680 [Macrococcus caseolyticus]PKE57277.1 hypothetical protein CW682_01310 [Macrococcus caseolyticus]